MNLETLSTKTRQFAQICAILVIGVAVLTGVGWLIGNLWLASFSHSYIPAAPGSMLGFILLALTLFSIARWPNTNQQQPWLRWSLMGTTAITVVLAIIGLTNACSRLEVSFKWECHIGQMSPVTAVFMLVNALILSQPIRSLLEERKVYVWTAIIGSANAVVGGILLTWYLFGQPLFYNSPFAPPSVITTLAFLIFGAGLLLLATPYTPWLRFLAGSSLQARLLRAFLPAFALIFITENLLEDAWFIYTKEYEAAWSLAITLITGGVFGLALWQITKNTANELDNAQAALQASEKRFRGIVEQSLEGIVLTDESGHITHWNAAQEAITKLPASKAIGRFIWEVQSEAAVEEARSPKRLEALKKMIIGFLETGQGGVLGYPTEIPMHQTDGTPIIIQNLVFPIKTEKGYQLCGVSRDITRRKQAEEALFWELAESAALSTLYKPLIAANTSLDIIAHAILEQAQSLTGSEHGYVSVIDPLTRKNIGYTLTAMMDHCQIEGKEQRINFDLDENGIYPGLWGEALNTHQPFYINKASAHPAARGTPQGHIPLEQFLSVPVLLNDELVGQIALANPGRDYTEHDLEAGKRLGEYFALAIQRHRIEEALKAERENLRRIFQGAPIGMLLLDAETQILDANPALGTIVLHEPANIIGQRGGGGLQCVHSFEDPRGCGFSHSCPACPLRNGVQEVLANGKSFHNEEVCVTLRINDEPSDRWLSISAEPLQINHKPHVIVAIDDITERKIGEQTLQLSEERYRSLFKNMQEGNALHEIICDENGKPIDYRFLEINPAFEKLTGLKTTEILGKTVLEVLPETEDYWIDTYGQVALTGKPATIENYARAIERWYKASAYSPHVGQFAVIFEDVTNYKQHEKYVEESLREKEVLLKEIHHRVKNNLQIVTSLLNLHSDAVSDPTALQAFQDCENNVRAIALAHEYLYRSPNLAQVDANEYLSGLLKHLQVALNTKMPVNKLDLQITSAKIDPDIAIPCGLLMTELFTNATKHAFPTGFQRAGQEAHIWVKFQEVDEAFALSVQDNGIGLPPDFSIQNAQSLGLQLVRMLAEQLRGKVEVKNNNGAIFRITFPKGG